MVNYRSEGFEMPENEPPESEIATPSSIDSRKAKVVALVAAAPGVALLCYWLYAAAHRFGLLPGTSRWAEDAPGVGWAAWAFAWAVLLAIAVMPLYFAFKIWRRPTLDNLRRVPFMAAVSCAFGGPVIFIFLRRREWISFKDTESGLLVDVGNLLLLLLTLGIFFLVKNAMVLWFKTPELAQPGLQPNNRRALWWLYCFFLWGYLNTLGNDLVEPYDDYSEVWTLIGIVIFVLAIAVALYVYKIGLRPLGLRPK